MLSAAPTRIDRHFKATNLVMLQLPTLPPPFKPFHFFHHCSWHGLQGHTGLASASPPHFVLQPQWPCCATSCPTGFAHTIGWDMWFNPISTSLSCLSLPPLMQLSYPPALGPSSFQNTVNLLLSSRFIFNLITVLSYHIVNSISLSYWFRSRFAFFSW